MKVLIVRLSAIGDVVQGIPCLVALKESFPDWKISWLVEETSAPILMGHPYLEKLFIIETNWRKKKQRGIADAFRGLKNILQIRNEIQKEKFDVTVDLQGLLKSGWWSWMSRAPRRMGHNKTREFAHLFLNEFVSDRPTFDPTYPLIERYLEPAQALGAKISEPHYILAKPLSDSISQVDKLLGTRKQFVALCPWSAWPSKNWPIDRWRELADRLCSNHSVLLLGSESESVQAAKICAENSVLNLVGKTSLNLLPEIFRRCELVIGPDTGLIHLANASGIPKILMLFGSTSWRRSGPLGKVHQVLSTELECQPCFERICPLGHLNCQKLLAVDQVIKTAQQMLLKDL